MSNVLAPHFIFQCFTKRSESALPHRTYERVSQSDHTNAHHRPPPRTLPNAPCQKHPCIATTSRGTAPRSTAVHLITPHLPRALCRFRPHLPRILQLPSRHLPSKRFAHRRAARWIAVEGEGRSGDAHRRREMGCEAGDLEKLKQSSEKQNEKNRKT